MPYLTSEQAAALDGSSVRVALLAEQHFRAGTTRLFNGFGTVNVAGEDWSGVGTFGSVDGLPQSRAGESSKVTLRLSGVDQTISAMAAASKSDVEGRHCFLWMQLFNDSMQVVGGRIALFWGVMQRLVVDRKAADDRGQGVERGVSLEVENPFSGRSRPPGRRYTDADQQQLHPGDQFCRFGPVQRGKIVTWPDY